MKIAIVKLSALGDIVHSMVVLQFIKKYNPEILIDWFVEESYKELLEFHPDINKLHLVNIKQFKKNKSFFNLMKEFKKFDKLDPYDLVIDMQGLIKSAVVAKLIPSKKTLGFDSQSTRESFASIFYNKTFKCSYEKNIIQRNIGLIEFAFGLRVSEKQILNKQSFLFSNKNEFEINLSQTKKNILLIPGASHKSKCLPISNLAELSTLIDANFLLIWGNQSEKKMVDTIKELSPTVTIFPKLSIDSLVLLISKVDLVIGPDTGPTHMAWGLNIPSIIFFGPTPGYRNTQVTFRNKIIESDSSVNPTKIDWLDDSTKNIDIEKIKHMAQSLLDGEV
jgi:heptosyltransferase I